MADDEWIQKVRKDRDEAEREAERTTKLRAAVEGNFDAKAPKFWERVVAEVERVVTAYNADNPGTLAEVEVEAGAVHCSSRAVE